MMHKLYAFSFLSMLLFYGTRAIAQSTSFERDPEHNTTATYEEVVNFYQQLDEQYKEAKLFTYGKTDVGKPLQVMVLSKDGDFDAKSIKQKGKSVILFNNGIHPGEPEGIDASMMLVRDMLKEGRVPDRVVLCFILVYNIDGMLNRGQSRVNQNGPRAYGFRGNRQNFDLNRDFIKSDSRNSKVFQTIFNAWDPDVFMDNHSSNGADYQYIMTLIDTQRDKLNPILAEYMLKNYTQELYKRMEKEDYKLIPYVSFQGETPESGIVAYLENPRYSTGYAALHNTIAYMPETHMWKPYEQRVQSTYSLMQHLIAITTEQGADLLKTRAAAKKAVQEQESFPLAWEVDTTKYSNIPFYGYEAAHEESEVSGLDRMYYDRSKPYTREIKLYDRYKPTITVQKPRAYVIPQAYEKVISLLALNGVHLDTLARDTVIEAEMYYIKDFSTGSMPYEGHYIHSKVQLESKRQQVPFYAGDVIVTTDQESNRYIVETLEPQAVDSYFNWNFFDAVLGQKEYFSSYIFEDEAARLLKEIPKLAEEFQKEKERDPKFKANGRAQLDWIYKRSPYYEKTHMRYPIARCLP
ncbi:M14 family zinc carboxypeptidase [Olivibacter sitiensis]|uniref:M14 family zinc carboxypeptidase n=1 Tax=Olivibacter sitiensis TaxID=376470 RepID=UPI00041653B1|nr:M14 family zinc carboxypeptidase [Olivibacter sitiensis]